ncbi:MAG: AAA family ATPase [Planctomycetales bacterium]|nr:AAA family ATPase [Planctomycetales bacterium]
MQLTAFRIQMYKCVIDSGWVDVTPLTVLVGKNEAGKTTLLKALHKFNPFYPEPYHISREWPRGHRDTRSDDQVVCTTRFRLTPDELETLCQLTGQKIEIEFLEITRDYSGRIEVLFSEDLFPKKLHPTDIATILGDIPSPTQPVGDEFAAVLESCHSEARRLANEGRFTELKALHADHQERLQGVRSPTETKPQHDHEEQYLPQYAAKLQEVAARLEKENTVQEKAHEFIVGEIPTFVYMEEYQSFRGSAMLDQVQQRIQRKKQNPDDESLLTILELSDLDLDQLVEMGKPDDREERQYDLDDAGATLTKKVEDNWGQLRYEVEFGADGQQFFTWVRDPRDNARIRLEERSRGFQWFFSFDLMLMHQTKGTLKGCVILLDEPGLHLHPEGQQDLLGRLTEYAEGNTLVYSTHLPFMIDLQEPERIRVLSDTEEGTTVTEDLTQSQPEAKLTLQAALGISGRTSYLVAEQNLVVEGAHDFWFLTALSGLLLRSGEDGFPPDLHITASGGASEVTYIATFMIGQNLDVVALYDTDTEGNAARDKLVNNWLTKYKGRRATALSLGPAVGVNGCDFAIEDLFPEEFYLQYVQQVYEKSLAAAGVTRIELPKGGQIVQRLDSFFKERELRFNKGSVAKPIRTAIREMKSHSDLPGETIERAKSLIAAVCKGFSAGKDVGEPSATTAKKKKSRD